MIRESTQVEVGQEAPPEARIWQAVIASTITDWLSGPPRQKGQAEEYLFHDNTDFPIVCQLAGVDVGTLRARLERFWSKNATCAFAA